MSRQNTNNMQCYSCMSWNVIKNGKTSEGQRYRCKDCGRTFVCKSSYPSSQYSASAPNSTNHATPSTAPKPKQTKEQKRRAAIIIAIAVSVWLLFWIVVIVFAPKETPLDELECITVDAETLAQEFKNDEDAAVNKYRGKALEITGTCGYPSSYSIDIDTEVSAGVFSHYEFEFNMDSAQCDNIPDELKYGDTVTIKGRFNSILSYSIKLDDAVYIDHQPQVETTEPMTEPTTEETQPVTETEMPTAPIAETSEPTQYQTTYWINTNSGKFHYSNCHTIKDKSESYWTTKTGSRQDMTNQGYSPCGVCSP